MKPSTAAIIENGPLSKLSQKLHFDPHARLQSQNYTLSFDFAVPRTIKLVNAGATIRWNEQVFPIRPIDYKIHSFKIALTPL